MYFNISSGKHIKNPEAGLPDDVFDFIGRNTPFVNIDLIVKNKEEKFCCCGEMISITGLGGIYQGNRKI